MIEIEYFLISQNYNIVYIILMENLVFLSKIQQREKKLFLINLKRLILNFPLYSEF